MKKPVRYKTKVHVKDETKVKPSVVNRSPAGASQDKSSWDEVNYWGESLVIPATNLFDVAALLARGNAKLSDSLGEIARLNQRLGGTDIKLKRQEIKRGPGLVEDLMLQAELAEQMGEALGQAVAVLAVRVG